VRAPRDLQVPFDRVTYRDGQLLASRDLQDDVRANQRLRALHTRYLHGTWGIALGFEVSGAVNDTTVRIGPGYATDDQGRELVLAETLDVAVPETSDTAMLVLVMTYQADAQFRPRPEVDAVCLGVGLNPRDERPLIAWRTPDQMQFGPDVPLATAIVHNGALISPPGLQVRRYAARQIRPHVGFATITPVFQGDANRATVEVDTSEAGFTTTPTYVAKLDFDPTSRIGAVLLPLLPFAFIETASPTGFRYVIPIRRTANLENPAFERRAISRPPAPSITLSWVGFEPVSGCEPHINPLLIFTLGGLRLDFTRRAANFTAISTINRITP
jgi:hypothetical protein